MPKHANDLDDDRFVRATALDAALRVTDYGDGDVTAVVLVRASLFAAFIRTGAAGPGPSQSTRNQIIREIETRRTGRREGDPVNESLNSLAEWIEQVRP